MAQFQLSVLCSQTHNVAISGLDCIQKLLADNILNSARYAALVNVNVKKKQKYLWHSLGYVIRREMRLSDPAE